MLQTPSSAWGVISKCSLWRLITLTQWASERPLTRVPIREGSQKALSAKKETALLKHWILWKWEKWIPAVMSYFLQQPKQTKILPGNEVTGTPKFNEHEATYASHLKAQERESRRGWWYCWRELHRTELHLKFPFRRKHSTWEHLSKTLSAEATVTAERCWQWSDHQEHHFRRTWTQQPNAESQMGITPMFILLEPVSHNSCHLEIFISTMVAFFKKSNALWVPAFCSAADELHSSPFLRASQCTRFLLVSIWRSARVTVASVAAFWDKLFSSLIINKQNNLADFKELGYPGQTFIYYVSIYFTVLGIELGPCTCQASTRAVSRPSPIKVNF